MNHAQHGIGYSDIFGFAPIGLSASSQTIADTASQNPACMRVQGILQAYFKFECFGFDKGMGNPDFSIW